MIFATAIVFAFLACKKETKPEPLPPPPTPAIDPSVIDAKNVRNSIDEIAHAAAIVHFYDYVNEITNSDVIAKGEFKNNGFKLTLPPYVRDGILVSMDMFEFENDFDFDISFILDLIEVNPPEAKGTRASITALDEEENAIGYFQYKGVNDLGTKQVVASYVYVDRAVSIKGNYSNSFNNVEVALLFDCSLKKGWNIVYRVMDVSITPLSTTFTITAKRPSDITWYWEFSGSVLQLEI